MPVFIISSDALSGRQPDLPPEEAHHALHVLRLKDGDEIQLTDGRGRLAKAVLRPVSKKKARAEIIALHQIPASAPHISVYMGLLKTRPRLETALEKLTEIGTNRIVLMDTAHTERQKFRMDRAEGIITSAVKQSKSAWMPGLEHVSFAQAVQQLQQTDARHHLLLAAHEKQDFSPENGKQRQGKSFASLRREIGERFGSELRDEKTGQPLHLHIFIGPEGGFAPDELTRMLELPHSRPLWLGDIRLRAETAAIQIAGLFRFGL